MEGIHRLWVFFVGVYCWHFLTFFVLLCVLLFPNAKLKNVLGGATRLDVQLDTSIKEGSGDSLGNSGWG